MSKCFILFHWYMCLSLYQYHTVLFTVAIKFENWVVWFIYSLFFFKFILPLLVPWSFYINFRISLFICTKILLWFSWYCIKSRNHFSENWHLLCRTLTIHDHGISLHFFNSLKSSFISAITVLYFSAFRSYTYFVIFYA